MDVVIPALLTTCCELTPSLTLPSLRTLPYPAYTPKPGAAFPINYQGSHRSITCPANVVGGQTITVDFQDHRNAAPGACGCCKSGGNGETCVSLISTLG